MLELQDFTVEREWDVEGIPVLSAAVSLPRPAEPQNKLARRIQRYYRTQARAYLRYCEKWLLPQAKIEYHAALAASTPFQPFRAELTYRITWQDDHFLSLYTQSSELLRAKTPLLTRRGDTWDLVAGYPVPLASFFPHHGGWKRELMTWAAEEIQRQESAGVAHYHKTSPGELRHCFVSDHYYLTESGLTFFFPMYAIAPAVEGIPAFTLPYGSLSLQHVPSDETKGSEGSPTEK